MDQANDTRINPKVAANPHEMTHCLEMRNLIECGEIIFRGTIERRESRFRIFTRLDHPERNDATFSAFWVSARKVTGQCFNNISLMQWTLSF